MGMNEVLLEAICMHEVLRRLGFKADDIYLSASLPLVDAPEELQGSTQVQVVLKTQGDEFSITLAFMRLEEGVSRDDFFDKWEILADLFNRQEGGADYWEAIYMKSDALKKATAIGISLLAKGFRIPKMEN